MRGLLKHTVEVQQVTRTQTALNTTAKSYATRIAALDCLIQTRSLSEPIEYKKRIVSVVYIMFCMYSDGSAIDVSDRVIWGSKSLEIVGIPDAGGQNHHLEIRLIEVK